MPPVRAAETRRAAQANYDRLSRWYDLLSGRWERGLKQAAMARLAVREGDHVLEIGPGTGHEVVALRRAAGATGCACAIDLSLGMLRMTSHRLRQHTPNQSPLLVQGDGARLPFPARCFDGILLCFTLELFIDEEIPVVLGECRRVLYPTGLISVAALSKAGKVNAMRALYELAHRSFPAIVDCRPIHVRASLEAAGFDVVESCLGHVAGIPVELVLARTPET